MKVIISLVAGLAFGFLVSAFVKGSFDILAWGEDARAGTACLSVCCACILAGMVSLIEGYEG